MAVDKKEFQFDIAVSFAGENRTIVERFASLIKAAGKKVFYDNWEQAELWGKDLYQHLHDVYRNKARYCVMFISEAYAAKAWTNHELKSAQERAFRESEEYILPVRLDDTKLPGIRETVGYIDLRRMTVEELAKMAIAKLDSEVSGKPDPKPTKAKSGKPKTPEGKPAKSQAIEDSQDFIYLADFFYRASQIERPDEKRIVLSLPSSDAQADSRLEALRPQKYSSSKPVSFAYANEAFLVRCESATSSYEGNGHKWRLTLAIENADYGGGMLESSYGGDGYNYGPDDIAKMRARLILLGEPFPSKGMHHNVMLKGFVEGMNTPFKVTSSPIQELGRKSSALNDAFLRQARLAALFYLRAGGVVERIERLALGPIKGKSVHVHLRGYRKRKYVNVEPSFMEIEGNCPLA